jgi:hypothetical protein
VELVIGLQDDHQVGQPLGVVDLTDEANIEQLHDFFTDEDLSLHRLLPWLLSHRLCIGANLEFCSIT